MPILYKIKKCHTAILNKYNRISDSCSINVTVQVAEQVKVIINSGNIETNIYCYKNSSGSHNNYCISDYDDNNKRLEVQIIPMVVVFFFYKA